MEIKILITDAASSVEHQVSVSGPSGYVPVVPATEPGAAPPGTGALAGINAGSAPAGLGDMSVVPATEPGAAPPGTGALAGINAGSAPAGLAAASAVGPVAFVPAAEGYPASTQNSEPSAGSASTF